MSATVNWSTASGDQFTDVPATSATVQASSRSWPSLTIADVLVNSAQVVEEEYTGSDDNVGEAWVTTIVNPVNWQRGAAVICLRPSLSGESGQREQ